MIKLFYILLFITTANIAFAQGTDMLSVTKKNGNYLQTFLPGNDITFQLKTGRYVSGNIKKIYNDTLYINSYIMGRYMTEYGFTVLDTINVYLNGYHYNEILRIKINKKTKFIKRNIAPVLMVGSAGYVGLNIINGLGYNEPIGSTKNIKKLSIAAGTFGLGYLIKKLFPVSDYTKKADKITYINMQVKK